MVRNSRSATAAILISIVTALWHAWCLFPFPDAEADAEVKGLIAKGAVLTPERLDALRQSLWEMAMRNRIWDAVLMVIAIAVAVALLRKKTMYAVIGLAAYGAIGLTYAATAMDVTKWGVGSIVSVQVSRVLFLAKVGEFEQLADQLFRLGTIFLAGVSLLFAFWWLFRRYIRKWRSETGAST